MVCATCGTLGHVSKRCYNAVSSMGDKQACSIVENVKIEAKNDNATIASFAKGAKKIELKAQQKKAAALSNLTAATEASHFGGVQPRDVGK